ncbi:MAG: phosphate/phosphite/phosphonate ABC transporter substrate-binding protein [Phycisphaera sp.]|nr:phosphate/phosphite/phosphonate ABC transporter substrate-binding protein [Phycisphaera sp.]
MNTSVRCLLMLMAFSAFGLMGCGEGGSAGQSAEASTAKTNGGAAAKADAPMSYRDPDTLKVALLPDEDASKLIQDNEGLKKYLEAKTGKQIELIVLPNYTAMVEAARAKHLDLVYFGPLSYCIAIDKGADMYAFAAKSKGGSPTYTSVVIANTSAGINKVSDLAGKKVGYGDPASTSSHLIPKGVLAAAGVKEGDYSEQFLGKHDVVAKTVEAGGVDAGGMSKPIFEGMIAGGKLDSSKVKIIAESAPIPQYPWAIQKDLKPELQEKIKNAFWDLDDAAILKPLKAERFAKIEDKDYNSIRDAAKILGKDLASLEK